MPYLVNSQHWKCRARGEPVWHVHAYQYLTPLVGGYLADRFIGTRTSLVWGAAIIAAGHFTLALPGDAAFYAGLGLIIVGTGFFKSNSATMVGQIYGPGDARRDAGFTIYYMGINLGAFIGPIICGYLGQSPNWGWHYGFAAAGVGMLLGLSIGYLLGRDKYRRESDCPSARRRRRDPACPSRTQCTPRQARWQAASSGGLAEARTSARSTPISAS